ncbi:hypothetical protein CVT24_001460 [Panaeolus cyanescens]|uniref:General transcription and DNA repair factor IIH subunit TFB5 n=1 Tax=Panaeolus cyanescens TaxID=181874 RepID=A0A409VTI5_9AGAR|nr:hypothetical protein CVT24_001460 [Panaeolus cyanescens]
MVTYVRASPPRLHFNLLVPELPCGLVYRSMKAIKGVLLICDPAVKQILLMMNEKRSFIIEDLDDHHLVIKADEEFTVRKDLEAELEKNTYSLEN